MADIADIERRLQIVEVMLAGPGRTNVFDMAANQTLTMDEVGIPQIINVTAACTLTIPDCGRPHYTPVVNVGSASLTIKRADGSTIGTIGAGTEKVVIRSAGTNSETTL